MLAVSASYSQTLAVIDEKQCIGCTLCIKACPFDAILGASKQMHTVITSYCTGCKLCVEPCPMDCISLQDNLDLQSLTPIEPDFDSHAACTRCDQCQPVCPNDLDPASLYSFIKRGKFQLAEKNSLNECQGCAKCDEVCPNNIPLYETFSYAIDKLQFKSNKKLFAQNCKQRMQTKEHRLNDKKKQQLSKLSNNKQHLADKLKALKMRHQE